MDILLLVVLAGCMILGLAWGALRMTSAVAALVVAVAVGRLAGPAAAALLAGGDPPGPGLRAAGAVLVGLLAGVVVVLAGKGLRRGVDALHLGWVDRIAGGLLAAAAAALVVAVVLALAVQGGYAPSSPWTTRLARYGVALLGLYGQPTSSSTIPSSTPATATSNGQQPR